MINRNPANIEHAQAVKTRYENELMKKPGVVGVGVGYVERNGQFTDEVCIVVTVEKTRGMSRLFSNNRLPAQLEGVPVQVRESGPVIGL